MRKCSVDGCSNTTTNCRLINISFHTFPKDVLVRQKWIAACNRPRNWVPRQNAVVCSDHFNKEDYQVTLTEKVKSMGLLPSDDRQRRILKKEAVPVTYNSLDELPLEVVITSSSQSTQNFSQNLQDGNLTSPSQKTYDLLIKEGKDMEKEMCNSQTVLLNIADQGSSKNSTRNLELELIKMEYKNEKLIKSNLEIAGQLKEKADQCKVLQKQVDNLEIKNKLLVDESTKNVYFELKLKEVLSPIFSANQVDIILEKKQKVKWTRSEMNKAFTLFCISKNAYNFMKRENYPLPAIRTLERYAKSIGVNLEVL